MTSTNANRKSIRPNRATAFGLAAIVGVSGLALGSHFASAAPEAEDDNKTDAQIDAEWANYDKCMDAALPANFAAGEGELDADLPENFDASLLDAVTIFDATNDGDVVSDFDFGKGDGTITITRTNGELKVTTSGDVAALSNDDQGEDAPETDEDKAFAAAHEKCVDQMPGAEEITGSMDDIEAADPNQV